ncbi:MAG: dihydrolipoyl dehydrogenase [Mycobacterium sp.]
MEDKSADLVILGGGSGGYACALRAAQLGQTVVLIEQDRLGGTCLHKGCIPTKALLHAAEIADNVRDSARFGVSSQLTGIDIDGVHGYKNEVVDKLYKGLQGLVKSRKIELVSAAGTLTAPNVVEAGGTRYTGRQVVLATGAKSKTVPGVPIGGRVVTSDQALELSYVPSRVIVLGGGVIGVEFASLWRSFGTEVTVVEALPRLVPNEDTFVSSQLERAFGRRQINVRTGTAVTDVTADAEQVTVTLDSGEELTADVLLVAVGRAPNTAGLGLEEVGVRLERGGFISVDDNLQTNLENVYAVGDVVAGLQLAHRGFQQGLFVAEHIAGLAPRRVAESTIPRVTYCEPEIASVGLTESAAREKYGDIDTVTYDLAGNGKSQILRAQGAVKLVKAGGRGTPGAVVGVHLVGSRVGELIGEAQLICGWEATAEDVAPLVHAHPTQHEALGEAHLVLAGKPLHAHG